METASTIRELQDALAIDRPIDERFAQKNHPAPCLESVAALLRTVAGGARMAGYTLEEVAKEAVRMAVECDCYRKELDDADGS